MKASIPMSSTPYVGAARTAHVIQSRPLREASGSNVNVNSVVVELVRNGATVWPKPSSAAIARPAAPRLPGAYPNAATISATAGATSSMRPLGLGTAALEINPAIDRLATWVLYPPPACATDQTAS